MYLQIVGSLASLLGIFWVVRELKAAPRTPHSVAAGDRIDAALASAFPLLGGVVFLWGKPPFVRFHARQSLAFGGATLAGVTLGLFVLVLTFPFLWGYGPLVVANTLAPAYPMLVAGPLVLLLGLLKYGVPALWLAIYLTAIVMAIMGREWEIPCLGSHLRRSDAGEKQNTNETTAGA